MILSKTAAAKLDNLLNYLQVECSERIKQNFILKFR